MTTTPDAALDLLRQVLAQFSDVPPERVVPEAPLTELEIDSLTAAEMIFELEDRLGVSVADSGVLPATVGDVLALIRPHLDARQDAPAAAAAADVAPTLRAAA
jgi:acyl carrier protein